MMTLKPLDLQSIPKEIWHGIFSGLTADKNPVKFCRLDLPQYSSVCTVWQKYFETHVIWVAVAKTLRIAVGPNEMASVCARSHYEANTPQQLIDRVQYCLRNTPLDAKRTYLFRLPQTEVPFLTLEIRHNAVAYYPLNDPGPPRMDEGTRKFYYTGIPRASDTLTSLPATEVREKAPDLALLSINHSTSTQCQWTNPPTEWTDALKSELHYQIAHFCNQQLNSWKQEQEVRAAGHMTLLL